MPYYLTDKVKSLFIDTPAEEWPAGEFSTECDVEQSWWHLQLAVPFEFHNPLVEDFKKHITQGEYKFKVDKPIWHF